MRRPARFAGELLVEFDRATVVLRIRCAHLVVNVALATERFAMLRRLRVVFQHFIVKGEGFSILPQPPLDGSFFIARRPAHFAVEFDRLIQQRERMVERLGAHARHRGTGRKKERLLGQGRVRALPATGRIGPSR